MWRVRISGVMMFQAEVTASVKALRLKQAWIVRGTQSEWGRRKEAGRTLE